MTMRHFDAYFYHSRNAPDYRGFPLLAGTIMQNAAGINPVRDVHVIVRNISLFKTIKEALSNKTYLVDVLLEKMIVQDTPKLTSRWKDFLLRERAVQREYKIANMFEAIMNGREPLFNSVMTRPPEIGIYFEQFRKKILTERSVSRTRAQVPLTYVLDHLFWVYKSESGNHLMHMNDFFYRVDDCPTIMLDMPTFKRADYRKRRKDVLAVPSKFRPRNYAFKDKPDLLKHLFNALYTKKAKQRKWKSAAKKTVYTTPVQPEYFYFDIEDTIDVRMDFIGPRITTPNQLIPSFFVKQGVFAECQCCKVYERAENMASLLPNTPDIRKEFENYHTLRDYLSTQNLWYDYRNAAMNTMVDVLRLYGTVPYHEVPDPALAQPITSPNPIPHIEESEMSYENHIHKYLTATFVASPNGRRSNGGQNPHKKAFRDAYADELGYQPGTWVWRLQGRKIVTDNIVHDQQHPLLLGNTPPAGAVAHLLRWNISKNLSNGTLAGVCNGCLHNIMDTYAVPNYFTAASSSVQLHNTHSNAVGPNVIRNYTSNPSAVFPGFGKADKEKHIMTHRVDWSGLLNKVPARTPAPATARYDTTMYMGVELEVTPNRAAYDYLREKLRDVPHDNFSHEGTMFSANICDRFLRKKKMGIVKSDSSTNYGFEIVTIPGTLAWHREKWQGFFKEDYPEMLQFLAPSSWVAGWINNHITLKRPPWYSTDMNSQHTTPTCGIHIHVSRAALTPLQFGKIVTFMGNRNNLDFVEKIAGRKEVDYAKYYPKTITEGYKLSPSLHQSAEIKGYNVSSHEDRRYSAINLISDKPTIEFRIFRSNVAKGGFMKNLDFVHAFCTWCKTVSMQELNVSCFIEFVEEKKGEYPWLYRYLVTTKQTISNQKFNPSMQYATEETVVTI